jgi:hypothetical protein
VPRSVRAGTPGRRGDALLLERLVHNLVENGIRHNVDPDRQAITSDQPASAQAGGAGESANVMGLRFGPGV